MSSKDSALRWLAGILLISALGLGFAIYNETSRPVTQDGSLHTASAPEPKELPAVESSASARAIWSVEKRLPTFHGIMPPEIERVEK